MTKFPQQPNKAIRLQFEHRPIPGKRKKTSDHEFIELAGKRFYYAGMYPDMNAAWNEAITNHPECEWVVWPRGGWGNPSMPGLYVRNSIDWEKEHEEDLKKWPVVTI